MRPAIVVMIAFALGACGSSIGGGGPDGAPADGDTPDQQIDGGPACVSSTPTTCYNSDCSTVLGSADCVNHEFRCPSGQISYLDCFGGDCNVSTRRYCRHEDGVITIAECSAGIHYCPPGTTEVGRPVDAGSDGAADR